jgi:hypothetical protein
MAKAKEILWDGERLALFSNLSDPTQVARFRQKHNTFFPRNFWNWLVPQVGTDAAILTTDAASAEAVGRLKREPPIEFWKSFQAVLREAWQMGFPLEECVRLISCSAVRDRLLGKTDVEPDLSSYPVWPYQRAVMFLGVEPWRARLCGKCASRYVADKPARRFCSNECSAKARQSSRAASWRKHGEKWRAIYKTKNAKSRSSRRTKR